MATSTILVLAGSLLFTSVMHQHLQHVPASFIPPNPNWVSSLGDTGPLNLVFLFTGCVSTDANENLHSQMRGNNNMHPQAKQCRARLRLITLGSLIKCSTDDDEGVLIEYSDRRKKECLKEPVEIPEACKTDPLPPLPLVPTQTLYYLSGWATFKDLRKSSCKVCSEFCLSTVVGSTEHSYATAHSDDPSLFTVLKSRGGLKHPSKSMHDYHLLMYKVMQESMPNLLESDDPIGQVMAILDRQTEWLPVCHRISRRVVRRLAMLRLHLLVNQASAGAREVQYDSRSAKRATSVN